MTAFDLQNRCKSQGNTYDCSLMSFFLLTINQVGIILFYTDDEPVNKVCDILHH